MSVELKQATRGESMGERWMECASPQPATYNP
jgi:hypothetical protein